MHGDAFPLDTANSPVILRGAVPTVYIGYYYIPQTKWGGGLLVYWNHPVRQSVCLYIDMHAVR